MLQGNITCAFINVLQESECAFKNPNALNIDAS